MVYNKFSHTLAFVSFWIVLGITPVNLMATGEGATAPLDEIAEQFSKSVDSEATKHKVAIVAFEAQLGFEEVWANGVTLARTQLSVALGKRANFEVFSRDDLAAVQEESLSQGKPMQITGVDYLVKAKLLQIGDDLLVIANMTEVKGARQISAQSKVEPKSLNIFLDDPDKRDVPPAESSIRMANSLMFDISRNHVKLASCNFILESEDNPNTIQIMEKRKKVVIAEMKQWSSTVLKELEALREIDATIVKKTFQDRAEYLMAEGLLENIDTTRQRDLLERFRGIYQLSKEKGLEVDQSKIIDACVTNTK